MKKGDVVRVKSGVQDVDSGIDIGGWQGRVTEVTPEYVMVAWDSLTLRAMPLEVIAESEEQGVDWTGYGFGSDELERAEARDTPADVEKALAELEQGHAWDWLGPEGELIQKVLLGTNPRDYYGQIKVWYEYLQARLTFPFEAQVDEHQDRGPLHFGDRVRVHGLILADDLYGVIVRLRLSRKQYDFPLADLAVLDESSENHALVQAYRVWFANR
ncbi:MAG: calcium-binding protein [Anaerolineales bacterium]